MNPNGIDIEWIVAEVVRRLESVARGPRADTVNKIPAVAPPATPPGTYVIDQRLVTMATLPDDLGRIRHVQVPPRAVVTPAVKDELRKRNIRVVTKRPTGGDTPPATGVEIVSSLDNVEAAGVARTLVQLVDLPASESAGLAKTVRYVAERVADPARAAIWLTDQPLAAVCLANRVTAIRAAAGTTGGAAKQAVDAIGANLLVVDPRQVSWIEWKNIVQQFQTELPRSCPAPLGQDG